ncbi:thioredoxin [Paenibacillus psychroresistens]|uniref:Thioredoxin n=1 Tax=Paenibacillus psychroresistens TaxID=1778678 RepID=A0A6B8RTZ4_9BACL|nr:thioredoxin family protein [Paenibacillus psychroresistens]QGQ99387.1 thioredoxin [Paenibacillus psychroresistens]
MIEWTQKELLEHSAIKDTAYAVFLYTPLCGTCKLAERMLDIIMTMQPTMPLYKSNINFLPQVSQDWQIQSIPCVVIAEVGKDKKMIYRMQAVDELYRQLLPLTKKRPYIVK